MDFFKGRNAAIATKHKKESVIAPIMENELGINCIVPKDLDTDILGTFTGEVERKYDPITTLRKKCQMAIDSTGVDIAIASEGSFGSHPTIFGLNVDEEIVMLLDKKNEIEIIERVVSSNTNFNYKEIKSETELIEFSQKIGFPSHGIILKKRKYDISDIIKDSKTFDELIRNYHKIRNKDCSAFAETDMRAMNNPTRMEIIKQATLKLVSKIKSLCPNCGTPGYGVVETIKGLPCKICGMPTSSALKHIYCCQKCRFQTEKLYPFENQTEDPQYCDYCNP